MPDTVRLVDYFYIEVADKPGEGARVLSHLKAAGVYLLDIHAFPKGRRAQVVFVPSDPAAFKTAAKAAKWKSVGLGTHVSVDIEYMDTLPREANGKFKIVKSLALPGTGSAGDKIAAV